MQTLFYRIILHVTAGIDFTKLNFVRKFFRTNFFFTQQVKFYPKMTDKVYLTVMDTILGFNRSKNSHI
jgi:hypothetical protein